MKHHLNAPAAVSYKKHTTGSVEFLIILGSTGLSAEGGTPTPIRCQQQFYVKRVLWWLKLAGNHTLLQRQI